MRGAPTVGGFLVRGTLPVVADMTGLTKQPQDRLEPTGSAEQILNAAADLFATPAGCA
jgi:hypothetical protein